MRFKYSGGHSGDGTFCFEQVNRLIFLYIGTDQSCVLLWNLVRFKYCSFIIILYCICMYICTVHIWTLIILIAVLYALCEVCCV